MNTTAELRRCTYCGYEHRVEALRVEKRIRPGRACIVRICPACQKNRKPPQVMA